MMTTTTAVQQRERMDQGFSVFNLHVNDAGKRADAEFIKQFGQERFDEVIKPRRDEGIMTIFHSQPTAFTAAWVTLVTAFVNEDAADDDSEAE